MKKIAILLIFAICVPAIMADTPTVTPSVTETVIETITETATETASETFSPEPQQSATDTATAFESGTFTPTSEESATFTPTFTESATETPTLTQSKTLTPTQTMRNSATETPTLTMTQTITPTFTATPTFTVTLTPVPTATIIDSYYDSLALTLYPNPVKTGNDIYMLYDFSNQTTATLKIYSLNKIEALEVNYSLSGKGRVNSSTSNLAPGVYYYLVETKESGVTVRTKIRKLVVLGN